MEPLVTEALRPMDRVEGVGLSPPPPASLVTLTLTPDPDETGLPTASVLATKVVREPPVPTMSTPVGQLGVPVAVEKMGLVAAPDVMVKPGLVAEVSEPSAAVRV